MGLKDCLLKDYHLFATSAATTTTTTTWQLDFKTVVNLAWSKLQGKYAARNAFSKLDFLRPGDDAWKQAAVFFLSFFLRRNIHLRG